MMDEQLANRIANFLNELVIVDSAAVTRLIASRVPCNSEMADHPTVQVGAVKDAGFEVGILGVLNGLCGCDAEGSGYLVAVSDEESGRILRFETRLNRAVAFKDR